MSSSSDLDLFRDFVALLVAKGSSFAEALASAEEKFHNVVPAEVFLAMNPDFDKLVVIKRIELAGISNDTVASVSSLATKLADALDRFQDDADLQKYLPALSTAYLKSLEFLKKHEGQSRKVSDKEVFEGKLREIDELAANGFVVWKNRDGFLSEFGAE